MPFPLPEKVGGRTSISFGFSLKSVLLSLLGPFSSLHPLSSVSYVPHPLPSLTSPSCIACPRSIYTT